MPHERDRAASSTTSACPTAASTCRTATRRRSAPATPTSWWRWPQDHRPTRGLHARPARSRLVNAVPRRAVLLHPVRHRQPDPELRAAGADRRPGRRAQPGRQPAFRARPCVPKLARIPGMVDLRVHQVANQPTLSARRRSHAGRAGRLHPARRRQQPAGHAERQRPDVAELLAEPGDRRQLPGRDADAAVPHRFARGPRTHPGQRRHGSGRTQLLENLAAVHREAGMAVVTHYNVQPVVDIFGSVQGRDLGSVAREMDADHRGGAQGAAAAARSSSCAGRSRR